MLSDEEALDVVCQMFSMSTTHQEAVKHSPTVQFVQLCFNIHQQTLMLKEVNTARAMIKEYINKDNWPNLPCKILSLLDQQQANIKKGNYYNLPFPINVREVQRIKLALSFVQAINTTYDLCSRVPKPNTTHTHTHATHDTLPAQNPMN